jgi:predicted RecA/RadA family phage recombinase
VKPKLALIGAVVIGALAAPAALAAASADQAVKPNAEGIFVLPKAQAARTAAIAQIPLKVEATGGVRAPVQ